MKGGKKKIGKGAVVIVKLLLFLGCNKGEIMKNVVFALGFSPPQWFGQLISIVGYSGPWLTFCKRGKKQPLLLWLRWMAALSCRSGFRTGVPPYVGL